MRRSLVSLIVAAASLLPTAYSDSTYGDETRPQVPPLTVFPFAERGSGTEGYGSKIGDFLVSLLAEDPNLVVVERADLQKTLDEQKLSLSGLVKQDEAVQIGRLTGAKILILGSIVELDSTIIISARITGAETGRIAGARVKGKTSDDLSDLAEQLAEEVSKTLASRAGELVAAPVSPEDRVESIKKSLGDKPRPKIWLEVKERHVGQSTIDPAAETEFARILEATGFTVIDHATGDQKQADIIIDGEAFSEYAARHNDLLSVRARVEIKAVRRESSERIATDRQTDIAVDVAEQTAGKTALQNAAAEIASRLLPKLVN